MNASLTASQTVSAIRRTRLSAMLSRKRQRPPALHGCTICVAGFSDDDKLAIVSHIRRMGATFSEHINPKTTHLVCERAGSEIHRAACEHNSREGVTPIIIVHRSWLESCQAAAMHTDTPAHVVLPLSGMIVCSSGFEAEEKHQISNTAKELGATYSKSLTADCTHLICKKAAGDKYEFAKEVPEMFIVNRHWIESCAELGLLLDETRFSFRPLDSKHSRSSSGTEVAPSCANSSSITPLSHRPSSRVYTKWQDASPSDVLDAVTLYLTESPLRENDKHAPLRAKALQLANLGGASLSAELTDLVNYIIVVRMPVAPSKIPIIRKAQQRGSITTTLEWLEQCILHQKLLSTANFEPPQLGQVLMPDSSQPSSQAQTITSSVFLGMRVAVGPLAVRDTSTTYTVCAQLASGRAKVLAHDAAGYVTSGTPTHVLCAPNVGARELEVVKDAQAKNVKVLKVTPFWVDMCVKAETLLPVFICSLFSPVPYEMPLSDMVTQKVSLSISGFRNERERDWNRRREVLKRLAVMLGAKCSERMRRRQTNYLIADSRVGESEKVVKAREWGIKVVTHEWLLACARAGKVVGAEGYAFGSDDIPTRSPGQSPNSKMEPLRSEARSQASMELPDSDAIVLFQKLSAKIKVGKEDDADCREEVLKETIRFSRRSRSVSRDGADDERSWSMDASQSQVIVHRDLTPPPSPTQKVKRPRLTL
ncbi:BRCT domain-containing protein [Gracilariopsis chorda]|uniref:BRCT domain-containing protein n=1 Tax=Gracilariopsis chorda TaxID=448386 RepID=A0A2V3IKK5_9FLOR|nr:BRCT domain-containing protein [Gracilariopsis chorda]|eukprot:PXF42625.1 BRCT domain-containing protein [Gracilariopsis chorda]